MTTTNKLLAIFRVWIGRQTELISKRLWRARVFIQAGSIIPLLPAVRVVGFTTVVSMGRRNTLSFLERWSVQMKRRRRIYFTAEQKREIWDRWQRGESMSSIGRGFDRDSSSIYPLLSRTGGIRPPDRKRSRLSLTLVEREEISRGLEGRLSLRCIARRLQRSASTISREVKRNGGIDRYRAVQSDQAAWDRACRPKLCKLACNRP